MWWDDSSEDIQDPTDWVNDIDRLLHSGEEIEEKVSVGDSQVVVTTQRVMFFTPYVDGKNVRYTDRPNVAGIKASNSGNKRVLSVGATVGLTGVFLLVLGNTLSLSVPSALNDIRGEAVPGAGMANSVASAIELIDTLLLILGVLFLANAAIITGYYFLKREGTVTVEVAGGEDVELSTREDEEPDRLAEKLRKAVSH